jgi:hypothetical protein
MVRRTVIWAQVLSQGQERIINPAVKVAAATKTGTTITRADPTRAVSMRAVRVAGCSQISSEKDFLDRASNR